MRVGSESLIFSLFMPKGHKAPSIADEKIDFKPVNPPKAPAVKSDEELLADLYDRTAQQLIDDADVNDDGMVSKDEYMAAQKRLADMDKRIFDPVSTEERWEKFDPTGKGTLDKSEVIEGLKKVLPLGIGHLDQAQADAIRFRPPTRV